jgi:hypothetical protein
VPGRGLHHATMLHIPPPPCLSPHMPHPAPCLVIACTVPDPHLSAASPCCRVYMLPMALGSAVNTWVSNCLGAGKALAARSMFRSGMALVVLLQTIIAGSLVLGGKHVAQVGSAGWEHPCMCVWATVALL